MKSNLKIIPIILAVGIFFTFSMFSNDNLNFNTGNSDENVDKEKIQISAVSGKIHIDGNSGWVDFKNDGNCTGNGTYSEPYVIEDLVIDGGGSGSCIWIENTNVYFKIENCTLYNFGTGINLRNVTNSLIIDNNANANNIGGTGIYLWHSDNNTITGNIANNNSAGISLDGSDYNTISGNTASDNQQGLYLSYSNNNTILGNYANTNSYGGFGINLWQSNNNTITGNTANNNSHGIGLHGSYYNTVSGNNANDNGGFGIDLSGSENNVISGNIANNNGMGIFLDWSNYNTISGNTANYNGDGIFLLESNYNIVSGNTLQGNGRYCIFEENCIGNTFSDNGSCTYGQDSERIPGYNLFILLGIISVVVIIMGEKLKKS